jgi:L,D-transpeptidase ErfK/SrfK
MVGTRVKIIYEPVKIGVLNGEIYIEVHPDTDGMATDMEKLANERLQEMGDGCYISGDILKNALQEKNGIPVRIGSVQRGGDEEAFHAAQEKKSIPTEAIN